MKLLIADDHALFRDALVQYIERSDPDSTVTLAKDLKEALHCLDNDPHQDLVILDLRMPGMHGLEGVKRVRERYPDVQVALMSGVAEEKDVQSALDLGVCGYFPKTLSGRALLSAIRHVVEGDVFVPGGLEENQTFMPSYYSDQQSTINNVKSIKDLNLTPRESEVLTYLVDGAANKEIARALDLQIVTVKLHVRGICRKLNAKNRTQAALLAKELGVEPVSAKVAQ